MLYAYFQVKDELEKQPQPKEKIKIDYSDFTKNFGYVVFFIFIALLISLFFKEKVLFYFLFLILAGMVLVNADKISSLLYRYVPR